MSISGNLEDVSGADVMQFIHLGRRTGTLRLEHGGKAALIGFHCGKLVSAQAPDQPKMGDLLVARGLIDRSTLEQAIDSQRRSPERRTLGQILVSGGALAPDSLRDVVFEQIRRTISEVVLWDNGSFEFAIDDLRPVDDIALYPGDVVPGADLNTQMVLLEAARIFDERDRSGPGGEGGEKRRELLLPPSIAFRQAQGDESAPPQRVTAPAPAEPLMGSPGGMGLSGDTEETTIVELPVLPQSVARQSVEISEIQVLSSDGPLVSALREASLRLELPVRRVAAGDAGVTAAGEAPPIVVVDLRPPEGQVAALRRLCRVQPQLPVVALVGEGMPLGQAYEAGAVAALPADPHAVAACIGNLLASRRTARRNGRQRSPEALISGEQATVARLRRVFGDLRSGLISATVALNLMHIISESVERAVLFLVRHDCLSALGAFGEAESGRPLAELTRGLRIDLQDDNMLTRSLRLEEARSSAFDEARLPEKLAGILGRPASGQVVAFPVLGTRRVIAMIYSDNGEREETIADIEILELATAQVGMAFENELLRHQMSKNGS